MALYTSINGIARQLTAEKVPSPMVMRGDVRQGRGWNPRAISRILSNPFYTGVAEWRKTARVSKEKVIPRPQTQRIPVKVPVIIDAGVVATVPAHVPRRDAVH